jgi:hypothetical protein
MAKTMCSEVVHVMVSSIVVLMMFNFVFSDLAADKRECNEQLASLSACLPFVGGDTKVPTPACCSGLRQEISKTEKCLCILVKDRNEPDLGFKINATLALSLPSICHAPANVSACPGTSKTNDFLTLTYMFQANLRPRSAWFIIPLYHCFPS